MIDNGYVILARKSLESDIWNKPPLYWKIWNYILLKAFYQEKGNLARGTFKTSIKELQDVGSYYVGYRKIEPTKKQIVSILDYLRKPNERANESPMIDTTKVTGGMLISVVKYEFYQDINNYKGTTISTRKEYEGNLEGTLIKERNIKNKRNINNYIFKPPTLEEVKAYCLERNNGINAERFIDFYEAKGWKIGKEKMKDWKACIRTWEKRNEKPKDNLPIYDNSNNPSYDQNRFNELMEKRNANVSDVY